MAETMLILLILVIISIQNVHSFDGIALIGTNGEPGNVYVPGCGDETIVGNFGT